MLSSYGQGSSNSLSRHTNFKNPVIKIKGFAKLFGHLSLKMILVPFYVEFIVQTVISDKLLQDRDIETNSEPTYNIERVVQGSFHQGIENCLVRLQVFSVHIILCMLCVGFR